MKEKDNITYYIYIYYAMKNGKLETSKSGMTMKMTIRECA